MLEVLLKSDDDGKTKLPCCWTILCWKGM